MPAVLKAALARAETDLDEVGERLLFLGSTMKLLASSGAIAARVAAENDLRALVEDFRNKRVGDLTVIYQGLYIQAFSIYESFVRGLIVEFVGEIAERDKTFDALKARGQFVDKHIYHTGFALQQVFENRTNITLDFGLLAKNLASVTPGSSEIKLNAAAFILQLVTLRPDGIEKALSRIGVADKALWDKFSDGKELKAFFRLGGNREVAKQTREYLEKIVKRRNHLVHRGESFDVVTESDVAELISFLRAFHIRLAAVLATEL